MDNINFGYRSIPGRRARRRKWGPFHCLVLVGLLFSARCIYTFTSVEKSLRSFKRESSHVPIIEDNFPSCDTATLLSPSILLPTLHLFTPNNTRFHSALEATPVVGCFKPSHKRIYATIQIRGHFSKTFDKTQVNLKIKDEFGNKLQTALFDLAPSDTYVLAGPFIDTSFLRNSISFYLHRQMGGKSPKVQYVNLYVNGEDQGLYYFTNKPNKHFIGSENVDYWVKSDWCSPEDDANCILTGNTHFTMESNVKHSSSVEEPKRILQALDDQTAKMDLVRKMQGNDVSPTPNTNLASFMDLKSFALYYIIEEISKNVDGYAWSNLIYIKDEIMNHASVWDQHMGYSFCCNDIFFTNFFGQVNLGVEGWNADNKRDRMLFASTGTVEMMPANHRMLWTNLFHTPEFYKVFKAEWKYHRQRGLDIDALMGFIDRQVETFLWSAYRDQAIWSHSFRCSVYNCCNPKAAFDVETAVNDVKSWLVRRIEWIDNNVDKITSHFQPL